MSGRRSHGLWFDTLGPDRNVFVAETCHLGADQRRSKDEQWSEINSTDDSLTSMFYPAQCSS